MPHSNRATANARLCYLFVEPGIVDLPAQCVTLAISPMLREMILHLADAPLDYPHGSHTDRLARVLLDELVQMPAEHLSLPVSHHPKVRALAAALSADPADRSTISQWAVRLALGERTLTRLIERETGLSFGRWRQQLHLLIAIRELAAGAPVQRFETLGYESVTAFITMFRKALGLPRRGTLRCACVGSSGNNPESHCLERLLQSAGDGLNRGHHCSRILALEGVPGRQVAMRAARESEKQAMSTTVSGDLTGQVSPDSGASSFTVDAAGNRKTATDARGVTATYHYDALNRLIGIASRIPIWTRATAMTWRLPPVPPTSASPRTAGAGARQWQYPVLMTVSARSPARYRPSTALPARCATPTASQCLTALTYPDGSVADYVRDTQGRISQIGLTRPARPPDRGEQPDLRGFRPGDRLGLRQRAPAAASVGLGYRPQAVHDPAAAACRWAMAMIRSVRSLS